MHNGKQRYFRYISHHKTFSKLRAATHAVWSPQEQRHECSTLFRLSAMRCSCQLQSQSEHPWISEEPISALHANVEHWGALTGSWKTRGLSERDSEKIKFEEAPSSYRSAVWDYFGFSIDYDENGKSTVTKQTTVCKHYFASIGYVAGNTTNMFSHLHHHHPSLSLGAAWSRSVSASAANRVQPTIAAAFQQLYATNSEKHKTITKAVGVFIAKDMQP